MVSKWQKKQLKRQPRQQGDKKPFNKQGGDKKLVERRIIPQEIYEGKGQSKKKADHKTKDRKEDKGIITNVDQIVTLVTKMGLDSALIETVKARFEKEERVLRVKQSMLDRIKNMDLLPIEKQVLLEIVEQTCQLSEVVGMGNRVIINQTPDTFDQVRLTDQTCWADNGGKLHLQLVLFGRYHCKAIKPNCDDCKLSSICLFNNKKNIRNFWYFFMD